MSLDRSLKGANSLVRHRNVLTRAERLEKLKEEERWPEGRSILGLPKVAHRKLAIGKSSKAEEAEGTEAPAGAAAAAAPAAGAKGAAAPAAGGKAAAAPAAGKAAAPAGGKKK